MRDGLDLLRELHTRVLAALARFQVAGGTPLPTRRSFTPHEAAGLWASLLLRTGGLEELEGRLVGAPAGKLVVKTAKGREERALSADALLYRGGGEAWTPARALDVAPGDRVRLLTRAGRALSRRASGAARAARGRRRAPGVHWVRRLAGAEPMPTLPARDASRKGSVVRRVDVLSRGASGRAARVRVTTDREAFDLSGLEIRFALSLPESLFTLVTGADGRGAPVHTFYGRGWGHGVGLCQNGTFGMALAGRSHAEILAAYYPGTSLGSWPPPASGPAAPPGAPR